MVGKKRHKKPRWFRSPSDEKVPRQREDPQSTEHQRISWHIHTVDRHGPWGWGILTSLIFWREIWHRVKNFETMTWAEIQRGGSHPIPLVELCRDAQKRLIEIGQDDIDELFSLRLSGRRRIWGIREGRVMKVLWWDPEHTVCSAPKKYT